MKQTAGKIFYYGTTNSEKSRIAKVTGKSILSFSPVLPYFVLPWHFSSMPAVFSFLSTVASDFFGLQFFEKWRWKHIPVINVQTPLDDKIPFVPSKVTIYLDFVNFWLRPLTMLMHRFGIRRSLPYCIDFLHLIRKAYYEAARVYKFRLSTTNRPEYEGMPQFKNIHKLDPHFLCVPSLHIAIVVLCYTFYRKLFDSEHFTQEEKNMWNRELYTEAVEIAESVLYIKQHSVNCIPAALYMMTCITEKLFSTDDAVAFINELFSHSDDIKAEDRSEIIDYIQYMYERLLLEGCHETDWVVPVQHWLLEYAHKTGQTGAY